MKAGFQDFASSGALIMIHWDSAGSTVGLADNVGITKDLVTKTEATVGSQLNYSLVSTMISCPLGIHPNIPKLRVRTVPAKPATFRLNVDSLVGKELGMQIRRRYRNDS